MSFFLKGKIRKTDPKTSTGNRRMSKRIRQIETKKNATKMEGKPSKRKKEMDEEIESDSDVEIEKLINEPEVTLEEQETSQEKKLRLTKQYLAQLQHEEASNLENEEIDKDVLSNRLKTDLLEQSGKIQKNIADKLLPPLTDDMKIFKGHKLSVTCVVISPDDKHIFSSSKDCSIIKWSVETGRRLHIIRSGRNTYNHVTKNGTNTHSNIGHNSHILALAISSSNKYLASGDSAKIIHIWSPTDCSHIHTFKGHRDAISGLSFRFGTHQLFSASHDRSVRIWNLDEMAFVETLYGHQDQITDIDSLARDRAITTGGRDGSVRIWKIPEESQLVFNGHKGCIECVSLINDQCFVTGGEDNCLLLWNVSKKKPCHTRTRVHVTMGDPSQENWITSVAAMKYTDLIISGSKDGNLRFWKCKPDMSHLDQLFSVPLIGFVNSLAFSSDGSFVVVGVGQEHKKGRWWRLKEAKNTVVVIPLRTVTDCAQKPVPDP